MVTEVTVADMAPFDEIRYILHGAGGIFQQLFFLDGGHEAEQGTGLGVVVRLITGEAVVIPLSIRGNSGWGVLRLFPPFAEGVWLIGDGGAGVAVRSHLPVPVIAVTGAEGAVDGDLPMVYPQPVALGIPIGEEAPLQHLVRGKAYAGHHACGVEGRLFHFCEVVFRIAVELKHADGDEGIVRMWPDFCEVKGVEGKLRSLFIRHDLNGQLPARIVTALDGLEEVCAGTVPVLRDDFGRFFVCEVADSLLANPVELDPHALVLFIIEGEGVAAEPVHVAEAVRDTTVTHDDGNLVEGLRQAGPEVPHGGGAVQAGVWGSLDGVIEIRELDGLSQEEDRGVVAHEVPVTLLRVELDGKSADVPLGIRRAALSGYGGETHKDRRLLADGVEELRAGIARDIMGGGEGAPGAESLGVHAALRDDLPVQVAEFFQVPGVLHEHGTTRSGSQGAVVVRDGSPGGSCQFLFFFHGGNR